MILIVDSFNLIEVEYVKTSQERHTSILDSYRALDQIKSSTGIYPALVGGDHLSNGVDYSEIVIYNPISDRDYLLSPYIAIPTTNNPIVTKLYSYYYLYEAEIGETPTVLYETCPLFNRILDEAYFLKVSPLLLIRFIEAYLNTEKGYDRSDLKSYSYALLYYYIEHVASFDQFVTYEQKGIEIERADLISRSIDSNFLHLTDQLLDGILPFIKKEYSKQPENFVLVTSKGQNDLLNDVNFFSEVLVFLKDNEKSILRELVSLMEVYDFNPRDPRIINSEDKCTNLLHSLKQHWLH